MKKGVVFFAIMLSLTLCACDTEDHVSPTTKTSNSSEYSSKSSSKYSSSKNKPSDGYSYDKNDKYYSSNDHNKDGKINDEEFQDAMGDLLDDLSDVYGY